MKRKWGAANFDTYLKKYTKAVEDTEGTVVWYNEACAWTPYHQSSNGETRNASEVLGTEDYPYICKRECPLDKAAEDEIQVQKQAITLLTLKYWKWILPVMCDR